MMSAANSRASESSVGKNSTVQSQSFSSCQYGSKSSLRFVAMLVRTSHCSRILAQRLAVQGRYNVSVFLSILTGSLQGIAERPLPCICNRIQRGIAFHGGNTGSNPVGDAKSFQ